MYTTLNYIRVHEDTIEHPKLEILLEYLGKTRPDDKPLPLLTILDAVGFEYTLGLICSVIGFEKEKLLLGVTYAREVDHLMPAELKKSLDVFERYANGLATEEEFDAARDAARDASDAAGRARRAAWLGAYPAEVDGWAAEWAVDKSISANIWAVNAVSSLVDSRGWVEIYVAPCAAEAAADAFRCAASASAAASVAETSKTFDGVIRDAILAQAYAAELEIRAKQESQLRQLLERTCTQL